MNRERTLLILIALFGVYLAGYYQITPTYLYSLTGKPSPVAAVKPSQVKTATSQPTPSVLATAQPTPWPAPEGER